MHIRLEIHNLKGLGYCYITYKLHRSTIICSLCRIQTGLLSEYQEKGYYAAQDPNRLQKPVFSKKRSLFITVFSSRASPQISYKSRCSLNESSLFSPWSKIAGYTSLTGMVRRVKRIFRDCTGQTWTYERSLLPYPQPQSFCKL